MKNCGLFLVVGILFITSCQQADQASCDQASVTTKAPEAETTQLKEYLDRSGISAKADSRGFFYTTQTPGSGPKPTPCSNVTVNYTGKLTNGTTFDSASNISFPLNQLIVGWQEGIPLLASGGSITLYLPPSLAYGSQDQNGIPANSILVFKIDLVKVN